MHLRLSCDNGIARNKVMAGYTSFAFYFTIASLKILYTLLVFEIFMLDLFTRKPLSLTLP